MVTSGFVYAADDSDPWNVYSAFLFHSHISNTVTKIYKLIAIGSLDLSVHCIYRHRYIGMKKTPNNIPISCSGSNCSRYEYITIFDWASLTQVRHCSRQCFRLDDVSDYLIQRPTLTTTGRKGDRADSHAKQFSIYVQTTCGVLQPSFLCVWRRVASSFLCGDVRRSKV